MTAVHYAAGNNSLDCLKILIINKADINKVDKVCSEMTALHYAAENIHLDCLKILINNKANINEADSVCSEMINVLIFIIIRMERQHFTMQLIIIIWIV